MESKVHSGLEIAVQRPVFNQEEFNENYLYKPTQDKGCCHAMKEFLSHEFSKKRLKRGVRARVPFIDTIRNYSNSYIVGDVVAGITVGIMQIPLGMAYAILGKCPAVTGLYTSFFPVLIYFFFGTSRHISQGTFAITSLMFAKAVTKYSTPTSIGNDTGFSNFSSMNGSNISEVATEGFTAIEVASSICLVAGVVQFIMGVLRLGQLSVYMSDTLISGFTTGAALLVFTSQFSSFFGITVPPAEWNPETIFIYYYVFSHITSANLASIIISIISITVLAFTCEVINPWVQPKIKVPIPIELLTVVVGTGVSYAMGFYENYAVSIVGDIPTGLPPASPPPVLALFSNIITDAIAIGVVTYIISYSLAKIFAKKHNYDINANQEFMAMGIANFTSSFFNCFPMCVALSRSMVLDSVGGKTQVAGLLSCGVVLIVLVAIAKLFKCLPSCVLAAIIVVGIRRMFLQFRDFARAWKISKLEALTWMVTFLAVSLTSIDIGLFIGVVFSILTIVFRSQSPNVALLGWVKETDLYLDIKKYCTAREEQGIKIYHYGGPVLFANAKSFRKTLYEILEVNPRIIGKKLDKLMKSDPQKTYDKMEKQGKLNMIMVDLVDGNKDKPGSHSDKLNGIQNFSFVSDEIINSKIQRELCGKETMPKNSSVDPFNEKSISVFGSTDKIYSDSCMEDQNPTQEVDITSRNSKMVNKIIANMKNGLLYLIIDGSAISFVDFSGVNVFIQIVDEYKKIGVSVYFAALKAQVLDMLDTSEFYQKFPREIVFPTVRDAVLHALFETKKEDKILGDISSLSTKL